MGKVQLPPIIYPFFGIKNGFVFLLMYSKIREMSTLDFHLFLNSEVKYNVKMQESRCMIHP
jgi:hypothetical protein